MGVFVWFHRGIARIDARKAMVHRYSNALNFRNADAAPGSPVTGIESVSKRACGHGVVGERSGHCGVASRGGNRTYTIKYVAGQNALERSDVCGVKTQAGQIALTCAALRHKQVSTCRPARD